MVKLELKVLKPGFFILEAGNVSKNELINTGGRNVMANLMRMRKNVADWGPPTSL